MNSRLCVRVILLLMVASLMATGCVPTLQETSQVVEAEETLVSPSATPAPTSRELRITYTGEPETLDAHAMFAFETQSMLWAFYDMFTRIHTDGSVEPWLITSWESNPGKDLWTLKVREGVTCHNGEVFDAEDVVYSLLRARDHPKSGRSSYMKDIGEAVAIDSHTVEIRSINPDRDFALDIGWVFGVCKDNVEPLGPDAIMDHPIGTGPYRFVEYEPGEHIKGERFDDYWGGPADFEQVTMRIIPTSAVRVAALMAGEVDHARSITPEEAIIVEAMKDARVAQSPTVIESFIDIDGVSPMMPDGVTPSPLADLRVRQALYMAIDIDLIVEEVMAGFAAPVTQFRLPSVLGYDPSIERLPYDPEGAKRLLADAGYPDGFEVEFISSRDLFPGDALVAEAVGEMWEAIGVKTTVTTAPTGVVNQLMLDGKARVVFRSSGMGTFDWPDGCDAWIKCGGRVNRMNRCWPDIDELCTLANAALDVDEREEISQRAARLVEERVVTIPMYTYFIISGVRNDIEWEPALSGEPRAGEFSLK